MLNYAARSSHFIQLSRALILLALSTAALPVERASAREGEELSQIPEIIVTARRYEENLQKVPDAISVFTSDTIEHAGIDTVSDFMSLVPNLSFRDGSAFKKSDIKISMRGVGNGQDGWPPVTFVVDGVPADSLDSINTGALIDIERIEVLRGPQSALYGAGAIAGAINVITRQPTDKLEFQAKGVLGKGDEQQIIGFVSGPIVPSKLRFRLSASYRDWDGLIKSGSNGLPLDFDNHRIARGQLLFTPTDSLQLDFRAEHIEEETGSTYQDKLSSLSQIETFNPVTQPRRRFAGQENRTLDRFSIKGEWRTSLASLVSVTSYVETDQDLLSSVCWDDPDDPAVDADPVLTGVQVGCLFGTALGSAAGPGEVVDNFFFEIDDYETFTQDLRLVSTGDGRARWVVGGQVLRRKTLNGFDAGLMIAPDNDFVTLFPSWHAREDAWWALYGQLSYDLTAKTELTVALRYDDTKVESTQYTDQNKTQVVQVPDPNGLLIDTQSISDNAFQPKAQLSYQWTDDFMTYVTVSRGFRAGFFNAGSFTLPEETDNFEIGGKTTALGGRLTFNAAVFHIDYSDQQFSTIINVPPFRASVTIPKTNIDGLELESTWRASDTFTLGASLGYLDSKQTNGVRSPIAPQWTGSILADFVQPLASTSWNLRVHGDYNYTSALFLATNEILRVKPKDFLNLRIGIENDRWQLTAYGSNLLDTRMATTQVISLAGGFERSQNRPRGYGIELTYRYD
jgi:iron complex outermembrane receptor protein